MDNYDLKEFMEPDKKDFASSLSAHQR